MTEYIAFNDLMRKKNKEESNRLMKIIDYLNANGVIGFYKPYEEIEKLVEKYLKNDKTKTRSEA